jgi:lipopolysaccharide/colanic/teichoic acid biosynthesis glycosyltransferase
MVELVFFYIYYISSFSKKLNNDIETANEVESAFHEEELPLELEKINSLKNRNIVSIQNKLSSNYLRDFPELYDFIIQNIDLKLIDESDGHIVDSINPYNINILEDHSKSLVINLHKINDIRWLNRYFLQVHRKIYNGGYLIGKAETLSTNRRTIYSKFPAIIAHFIYLINFVFKRVVPKLPFIKRIYFMLTHGKGRIISQAEVLGRLHFCGFNTIAVKEINTVVYFIAQRIKNPSIEKNPSYGPVVRLKRVGFRGDLIQVYKFRTMHPYSEFLQEYIYDKYGSVNGDKFNNDFRVTSWGRIFRKFWIDEIPMIYNLIRGDIALVGVRPLSLYKFSIYRESLKKKRVKFKPGLIPPFYADMPDSLEGLMDSEEKYLDAKAQKPFTTDIVYFFKAFFNIFFKNARSR